MAKLKKKTRSYYYWRAREVANDLAYHKQDVVHERTMSGYYDYAMDQIQKEIDRFYSKYASAEGITLAEAKKRVSQLDIDEYSRKAKKYVAEKDFTAQANKEMKLYNATMKINRLELLKAKIGLETVAAHSDAEKYMKEILNGRTVQEIKRQAGILGESIGANAKTVNSIVDASFHNAKWSTRIWGNQALLKAELSKILTNGLTQGKSSRELTRELRKAVESSKQNASRLMRTELSRVRNDAQLESIKRNGFEEYMFHTLSSSPFTAAKVCPICADLDGKVFKVKDAVVGDNMPPMHPNCRCSISAYEDEEEYQKWLNNYTKGDNELPNYSKDPGITHGGFTNNPKAKAEYEARGQKIEEELDKHIRTPSRWSKKVNIAKPGELSGKEWNCDITLARDASEHEQRHEHIHARSVSAAGENLDERFNIWVANKGYEDFAVEFANREIGKASGAKYKPTERDRYWAPISCLKDLNKYLKIYPSDYEFAMALIEVPLKDRKTWLRDKVVEYSNDFAAYNKGIRILKELNSWWRKNNG